MRWLDQPPSSIGDTFSSKMMLSHELHDGGSANAER
jgi:hypothetical protein